MIFGVHPDIFHSGLSFWSFCMIQLNVRTSKLGSRVSNFSWKLFFFRGSVSLKNYEQCIKLWFQFCKLYVNCHFISIENVFVCSRRKWRHRNYEILNVRTSKLGSRVSNFSWKLFFLILFYFEMELWIIGRWRQLDND